VHVERVHGRIFIHFITCISMEGSVAWSFFDLPDIHPLSAILGFHIVAGEHMGYGGGYGMHLYTA